jgi:hypothetical protein
MTKLRKTVILCAFDLALATPAFAETVRTRSTPAHEVRPTRSPAALEKRAGILRQDLFDRINPNNLRSDWPAPPAQPGQY